MSYTNIFVITTIMFDQNSISTKDPMEAAATGYALRSMELNSPDARRAVDQCRDMQQMQCDPYKRFRTADGTCNNLYNPEWGKAAGCFSRLLPPDYADGLSAPRLSVT